MYKGILEGTVSQDFSIRFFMDYITTGTAGGVAGGVAPLCVHGGGGGGALSKNFRNKNYITEA